jgi:hypothetical protein
MNGIEVAVKSPKTRFTLRPKDLKKFEKEVSLQAKVRVPPTSPLNIVTFFDKTLLIIKVTLAPCLRCATLIACKLWQPA